MNDVREWWLQVAKGLPVGQMKKVKHPYDGQDKLPSVLVWNSTTSYGAKCFRRGTVAIEGKDTINLAMLAEAQAGSARSDVPTDMEAFDPTKKDWVTGLAVDYLLKRNVDPSLFNNCYLSPSRLRLIFKEVDTRGNTGYIGRDITEKHQAKSVNYIDSGVRLINCDLHTSKGGGIILVEDINSAYKVRASIQRFTEALGSRVISLNGTSGSASLTLTCADEDVVIWLDGDEAGDRGAIKLLKDLTPLAKSIKIITGEGDPKDYTYTEIQEVLWATKCSSNVKVDIREVLK